MPKTKSKPPKQSSKKKPHENGHLTAKRADRHDLYERSVQEPEAEIELLQQVWKEQRGRDCESIREDFCGTAVVCMEWVKTRRKNTAVGVDLDAEVLGWGRSRIPQRLNEEQASRITLLQEDVRTVKTDLVDCILAMNFSYYLFRSREELRNYFASAREGLVEDGMLLLDAYGGSDSFTEMEEEREIDDDFTYIWDQHKYDPISGEAVNYIHFEFPDGSKIRKAFEYRWRLWTLPEIRELLHEAGFRKVVVYWEGTDEDGEGDGEWAEATEGEACPGWVAYLAAVR
ncbi:MAG: class I SAM-dependent methyltransferase [Planctomycetota bacterium]